MKLCKDCKHYSFKPRQYDIDSHTCSRFMEIQVNLITGEEIKTGKMDAYHARYNEEVCGKEGKLWEPK